MARSSSSTDISGNRDSEESLPFLSEKQMQPARPRPSRSVVIKRYITVSVLLLASFVGGAVFSSSLVSRDSETTSTPSAVSRVPDLPLVPKTFYYERLYSGAPSNESNAAWEALMPQGRGFVDLPSDDLFDKNEETLAVSVFHQLHCLYILREGYYALADPEVASFVHTHSHGRRDSAVNHEAHMIHCFDYLRQALMCAADATLEPVNPDLLVTDGWGAVHICRDYDALFEWSEMNSRSNAKGIGNGVKE